MAMRGPDHINGTVVVVAFDGLGVNVQTAFNEKTVVNKEADQGPAKATWSTGTRCGEKQRRSRTPLRPPVWQRPHFPSTL